MYSSLYPSIILENNIAPNTQIGRVIIDDENDPERKFSLNEHPDMFSNDDEEANYSRGGEFLENIMNNNILEFCRRWFNLGGLHEVINDIKEFFIDKRFKKKNLNSKITDGVYFVRDSTIDGIEYMDKNSYNNNNISGVIFDKDLDKEVSTELESKIRKGALL